MAVFQLICRIFKFWLLIVTNITKRDNIRKDYIRDKVGVTTVDLHGGKDVGSEIEMVRASKIEMVRACKSENINASLRRCESGSERLEER